MQTLLVGVLGSAALLFAAPAWIVASPFAASPGAASTEVAVARRSALRALTALEVDSPEQAAHLAARIKTLDADSRPPSAKTDDWYSVLQYAATSVRDAELLRLDGVEQAGRIDQRLQERAIQLRELDLPWLPNEGRRALGTARATLARAVIALEKQQLSEAERLAGELAELGAEIESARLSIAARFESAGEIARWSTEVKQVMNGSRQGGSAIVVEKWDRRLSLVRDGRIVASWPADLGKQGLLRKLHTGDQATPEGKYRVSKVLTQGMSRFHKALLIDYPNASDRDRYREAVRRGLAPNRGAGGLIEIHGQGGRGIDWTDGCIAVGNDVMDRLAREAKVGTPVIIVGRIEPGILR